MPLIMDTSPENKKKDEQIINWFWGQQDGSKRLGASKPFKLTHAFLSF
jgi:hypothetical protein